MPSGSGTGTPVTSTEPVSLALAKSALRVDISTDDTLIAFYISTARSYIERICRPQLAMMTQTCSYVADAFPASDVLELRPYPLQSVTSIVYTDSDGVAHTISANDYLVATREDEPGRIILKRTASWPTVELIEANGFVVTFVAGFGSVDTEVPHELRQAILLLVGHQYENREALSPSSVLPKQTEFAVNALIQHWRREI